jgi:hypothetical protein
MENQLADRVRKACYVLLRHWNGQVFDTRQRIGVRTFASQKFQQCLLRHSNLSPQGPQRSAQARPHAISKPKRSL